MGRHLRRVLAPLVCAVWAILSPAADADPDPPAPPPESMSASVVPMPPGVVEWSRARYTADGNMVATFKSQSGGKNAVGWLRPDGTGFHCITCAPLPGKDVGAPLPFPDGRRLFVQSPSNMNAAGTFSYHVIECVPSLEQCDTATTKPVQGLVRGLTDNRGTQDREMRLAPAGDKLLWTRIRPDGYFMLLGDIVEAPGQYLLEDVRVVNPRGGSLFGDAAALALAAPWYEAKDLSHDGRFLTFSGSMGGSLNYDNFLMDLETGSVRRLTVDPDWDEDAGISPDGQWFVSGTSKGMNRQAAWGNVPRPPMADIAMVGPLSNMFLPRTLPGTGSSPKRIGSLRHVLVDINGERGEYNGQPIEPPQEPEWTGSGGGRGGSLDWAPDGVGLLRVQTRRDPVTGADLETRLQIVHLTERAPHPPVVPAATTDPSWAPLLSEVPVRSNVSTSRRLAGPAGGSVNVVRLGNMLFGYWALTYDDYSADGCSMLAGTQSTLTLLGVFAQYSENTRLTGCHDGYTTASVRFAGSSSSGRIVSEYDGRHFERTIPFSLDL